MDRVLLLAASLATVPLAGAAGLPDCVLSLHAVSAAGLVDPEPLVGDAQVAAVTDAGSDAATGRRSWLIKLDDQAAEILEKHTTAHVGRSLAVRCDGEIIVQPTIEKTLTGELLLVTDDAAGDAGVPGLDDPLGVLAWVEVPRAARAGDAVTLRLTVLNARPEKPFRITSVDIGDGFLEGFELLEVTPEPRQRDHSLGTLTMEYAVELAPDREWTLTLELRARQAGVFVGDVDVWESDRFLTRVAQIRLR